LYHNCRNFDGKFIVDRKGGVRLIENDVEAEIVEALGEKEEL
jgi:hypothetical protein